MKHSRWMGTLAFAGLVAGLAPAQSLLSGVTTKSSDAGVEVNVAGTKLGQPKVIRTKGNHSFVLEWDAKLTGKPGQQSVGSNGVKYVWFGWFDNKPPKVRVQLWLEDASITPAVTKSDTGWSVTVGRPTNVAAASSKGGYTEFYDKGSFEKLPPLNFAQPTKSLAIVEPTASSTEPKSLSSALNDMGIGANLAEKAVSLDFVNTDVTLILKALASQADVNIVTSSDVSGKINVKLDQVPLVEALNLVTTIAGVRYTKIGKTFIVTSTARFSDAIRQVVGKLEDQGETRVVQLMSGEGKQIKAATLKAVPQLSAEGFYDLILPTEKLEAKTVSGAVSSNKESNSGSSSGEGAQGGGSSSSSGSSNQVSGQGAIVQTTAETQSQAGKDAYVVVVATPERIEQVVAFVNQLDRKIAEANSLTGAGIATRDVPIYSPNADVILDSLKNIVSRDPKSSAFKLSIANGTAIGGEEAGKILVLTGPSNSLSNLEAMARATDNGIAAALGVAIPANDVAAKRMYEVVDLRWVEPIEAAAELESRVRGLSARLMPAYVDPNVKGTRKIGETTESTSSQGSGTSGQATGGQAAGGAEQGGSGAQASAAGQQSVESKVTSGLEKGLGTEPMRLLLYGTRQQLDQARSLLGALDMEPKMVAIDMRVLELSVDDAKKLGLDWGITTGGIIKSINVNNTLFAAGAGSVSGSAQSRSTKGMFESILDAATTKNNLVSRPNTIALDGKATSIFIGDTIRYVENIQSSQNGQSVTIGKVDVGVTLNLTARVGADGTINMNLNPILSILKGFTPIGDSGGQVPQTAERRTTSSVTMKSGETVALGGLVQDQDRTVTSGIPFLKDLPIVGRLFRSETTQKVRSEIVFFVTAKVVDSSGKEAAADPRANEKKPN